MNDTRTLIIEALENLGEHGMTRDEIMTAQKVELTHNARKGYSVSLRNLVDKGKILERGGLYFPVSEKPTFKQSAIAANSPTAHENAQKITIAPFMANRQPKTVTLYAAPASFKVIAVHLILRRGGQVNLPMRAGWRICYGEDSPDEWGEYRDVYRDVRVIRLIMADGRNFDQEIRETEIVTTLQEEG